MAAANECYIVHHNTGLKRVHSDCEDSEYSSAEDELDTTFEPVNLLSGYYEVVSSGRLGKRCLVERVAGNCNPYLTAFLQLFEDEIIQDFLWVDSCAKLADKYLLAMVYVYLRRAGLPVESYDVMNFFVALYLANDMEEDEEDEKYEIFPWALGSSWMTQFPAFLLKRDDLWRRMGFRAIVSRRTCEEVIAMAPEHEVWQRVRFSHHGGAIRTYSNTPSPSYGRSSPKYCELCMVAKKCVPLPQTALLPKRDLLDEIDSTLISYSHHQQCLLPSVIFPTAH